MTEKTKLNKKRTFQLKPGKFLELSGHDNVHQISLASQISAYTGYKYINNTDRVKSVDLEVFIALLSGGAGLSEEKILNMKLGDLFEFVDADD